jgi:small subunit ribosomal protein S16
MNVKEDRVFHWMKNGAKPTESVEQVFKTAGTLDRWERFNKGEDVETLMKEAAEAEAGRNTTVKTRRG